MNKSASGVDLDGSLARLMRLALRLGAGQSVTSSYIRERFGVSPATAKRDMLRLESLLPLTVEEFQHRPGQPAQKILRLSPGAGFSPLLRMSAA